MRIVAPIPKNLASKAIFATFTTTKNARQFYNTYEQKFSNLRPFLSITFPQEFQESKILEIGLWEVGGKRHLNGVNK